RRRLLQAAMEELLVVVLAGLVLLAVCIWLPGGHAWRRSAGGSCGRDPAMGHGAQSRRSGTAWPGMEEVAGPVGLLFVDCRQPVHPSGPDTADQQGFGLAADRVDSLRFRSRRNAGKPQRLVSAHPRSSVDRGVCADGDNLAAPISGCGARIPTAEP